MSWSRKAPREVLETSGTSSGHSPTLSLQSLPACPTPCTSSRMCLSTWPTGRAVSALRLDVKSRGERGPCGKTLVRTRSREQSPREHGTSGSGGGYVPRLPQRRWAPGFGTELGRGAEHRLPMAAHCRLSPGAWERVARSLDIPPPEPSMTHALPRLPGVHVPKIIHSLRCSLLINKHILPVHHGEGIEHRAQGLDGCGRNRGSGHSLLQSPLHTPPALSCCHIPRETPMLGPILRRE